jgi:hypothetical protein
LNWSGSPLPVSTTYSLISDVEVTNSLVNLAVCITTGFSSYIIDIWLSRFSARCYSESKTLLFIYCYSYYYTYYYKILNIDTCNLNKND